MDTWKNLRRDVSVTRLLPSRHDAPLLMAHTKNLDVPPGRLYKNTDLSLINGFKGSRNNNFPEFAPRFMSDLVDLREHNRRRRMVDVEDCASENRPKLA